MGLFKIIDGLLVGTKYLAWGMGVLGIILSIVLFFANISLGFASAATFIAALLLSVAVTLLLWPTPFAKGVFGGKGKYIIGGICLALAVLVFAIVYFVSGGFPALNLLFV